jgi:hypothetical protein
MKIIIFIGQLEHFFCYNLNQLAVLPPRMVIKIRRATQNSDRNLISNCPCFSTKEKEIRGF